MISFGEGQREKYMSCLSLSDSIYSIDVEEQFGKVTNLDDMSRFDT
jgi:hypothetical protein